jgi:hypothetical protein
VVQPRLPRHVAPRLRAVYTKELAGRLLDYTCEDRPRPVISRRVERPNAIGAKDAIDVVIAWVDGRDRKHRAKRRRYLADPGGDARPERGATDERRFSDNDEIRFCLRSIRNYAPWVRTIWLVTDDQVPAAIDRQRAERDNIRVVDHREIFRGHEELLPTFNSLAIETMLWRIEGLADRFLYFNDDMMFVGPVEPMDFFSKEGRVTLRGRWSSWNEVLERGNSFNGHNKLLGAEMLGYTSERFFSSGHVIYPQLRPAMEELFEQFKPAFLANAEYRFRNRKQFWPISAHDHLLLKSDRARVVKPRDAAHFSVRYCLKASPEARCDGLSVKGNRASRGLRKAVSWHARFTPAQLASPISLDTDGLRTEVSGEACCGRSRIRTLTCAPDTPTT